MLNCKCTSLYITNVNITEISVDLCVIIKNGALIFCQGSNGEQCWLNLKCPFLHPINRLNQGIEDDKGYNKTEGNRKESRGKEVEVVRREENNVGRRAMEMKGQ